MNDCLKPWVQTPSGQAFELLNPTADTVVLSDIYHALARNSRFTGHTHGPRHSQTDTGAPYSVAQHSILVWQIAVDLVPDRPYLALHALLHDAHEAYLGDISTPVIWALECLCPGAKEAMATLKMRIQDAILEHLELRVPTPFEQSIVKLADITALFVERRCLLSDDPPPRPWQFDEPEGADKWEILKVFGPLLAQELFTANLDKALAVVRS